MKVYRYRGLVVQYREGEQPPGAVPVEQKQAPTPRNKQRKASTKKDEADVSGDAGARSGGNAATVGDAGTSGS